jgi:N-acetylglutamate synthase-like GNAT family acetyltransferase
MNHDQHVIRRANVDDLAGLRTLWERAHLQVLDLEKRLTDFQLIATPEGDLIGALGLQIDQKQGCVHSEAYLRPEDASVARPLLWERIQTLARNHGLARLWTRESAAAWGEFGFVEPTTEQAARLPAAFGAGRGQWFTLGLRDESAATISVEREFELFQLAQRARTEELLLRAKRLKIAVVSVVLLFAAAAMVAALVFLMRQGQPGRRPGRVGGVTVDAVGWASFSLREPGGFWRLGESRRKRPTTR